MWVKLCPGCDQEKEISEFKPSYVKGKVSRRPNKYCRTCLYPPNREGRTARLRAQPWKQTPSGGHHEH